MTVLVTGAAGFIGFHVTAALLKRGERVIGVDNLNDYYDVALKQARLDGLARHDSFAFHRIDIADQAAMEGLAGTYPDITRVVHLAAQAGVRYSLTHPQAYIHANLEGHFAVLETCRRLGRLEHLVYASSSTVYSGITRLPFSIEERVERFSEQVQQALTETGEAETYIHQLEQQYDANLPQLSLPEAGGGSELPEAEDLLTDLESFLREQRNEDNREG